MADMILNPDDGRKELPVAQFRVATVLQHYQRRGREWGKHG
jgi:hypothetical protein